MELSECVKHEEHERRIGVLEKDLSGFGKRVNDLDKDLAIWKESITHSIENLSKLPATLEKMNDSMVGLQRSLDDNNFKTESLREEVKILDEKVDVINEEGKFNIRSFIKSNWPTLMLAALALFAWGSKYVNTL